MLGRVDRGSKARSRSRPSLRRASTARLGALKDFSGTHPVRSCDIDDSNEREGRNGGHFGLGLRDNICGR